MKELLKKEIEDLKYHIFGFLSFLIKFVAPVVFVLVKAYSTEQSAFSWATWGLLAISVLAFLYYGIARRWLTSKKNEESIVRRLDASKSNPLGMLFFIVIDDIVMMPILPAIMWLIAAKLEEFSINVSTFFMFLFIFFIAGGIFKLIDIIINYSKEIEEDKKKKGGK